MCHLSLSTEASGQASDVIYGLWSDKYDVPQNSKHAIALKTGSLKWV